MSMIERFFTQVVTIKPFIREGSGKPVYGDTETRKCRLEFGVKNRNGGHGASGTVNAVTAGCRMFCCGDPIPMQSIVTYKDREFVVTDCHIMRAFAVSHLEVTLE